MKLRGFYRSAYPCSHAMLAYEQKDYVRRDDCVEKVFSILALHFFI